MGIIFLIRFDTKIVDQTCSKHLKLHILLYNSYNLYTLKPTNLSKFISNNMYLVVIVVTIKYQKSAITILFYMRLKIEFGCKLIRTR